MAQRPVTLADIVRGHVSLEIEEFDRLYFNGWVPALQTSGQIAGWLHWRGFPIASPATLGRNAQAFRAAVRRYADGNQIPWVVFRKGDRKLEVIRPYLDAAEEAGQCKVVAIAEAREFQWVFDATKKDGPDGVPWFRFYRTERLVTCYYFYIHDRRIGPAFIKVCCYAPYPVKVWCNGHEIARRAALAEGIAVTPLANGWQAHSAHGDVSGVASDSSVRVRTGRADGRMSINVTNYGVQSWLITPAAYAVNETPPTDISDQRWLLMLSGVAEVNMEGTSTAAWQADQVFMLGAGTIVPALDYAITQWGITQPPETYPFFAVSLATPFAGLSKVFDAGESVNSGFAVNYWELPLNFGTNAVTGQQLENIFNGTVEVGVRDNDAWLYSVGYNIALLGNIVFQY